MVLVLNITSAVMCASYADREKEDREGPRETTVAGTERERSHDRNHRLAFFSGFKHPLHQPPPDLSFTPCRLSSRSKERARARVHFPFSRRKRKDVSRMRFYPGFSLTLLKVSARFPVLLVDVVFYSTDCTVGNSMNTYGYNKI